MYLMFLTVFYLLALVFVLTMHEWAHAFVATRLGDPTPERLGRLSFNPLRHLDPVGTLALFLVGLGWAKPVPVNPRNFKHPIWDEGLTALAGPLMNLIIAVFAGALSVLFVEGSIMREFFNAVLDLSLYLMLFNLLPIPPLDGSHFWVLLLPPSWRESVVIWLERHAVWFLVFLLVDTQFLAQYLGFSLVSSTVAAGTYWLKTLILLLV